MSATKQRGSGKVKYRLPKLTLALSLVLGAAASPASSQELWQNVRVGMSAEEVSRAQPDARPPAKPDTLKGGAVCALQLAAIAIDGHDYRACFFFLDQRLVQVMLSALGEPSEPQFRSIVTLLRSKYGPELSLERTALGYGADWMTPNGVNVSVTFMNRYGNLLNINYQVRMASEREKL